MLTIGVLASGNGTNLQAIINALEQGEIKNTKIQVVISNNKQAYALQRAEKHQIRAVCVSPKDYQNRQLFHQALLSELEKYALDLIVLAGFLVTIPQEIICQYKSRIINIHPSLIPAFCGVGYYGLKVHQKALERGVKITGATVHYVDEGIDSGSILLQKAVVVLDGDTPEELQKRVMEQAEWVILPKAIALISQQKEERR